MIGVNISGRNDKYKSLNIGFNIIKKLAEFKGEIDKSTITYWQNWIKDWKDTNQQHRLN